MNLRALVVLIFSINFLTSLGVIALILGEAWDYMPIWQKVLIIWQFITAFCSVLISFWVYRDGENIKRILGWPTLQQLEINKINRRLLKIEEKVGSS